LRAEQGQVGRCRFAKNRAVTLFAGTSLAHLGSKEKAFVCVWSHCEQNPVEKSRRKRRVSRGEHQV
jgi:hypothetical protein